MTTKSRSMSAFLALALLIAARPTVAADLTVTVPTVSVAPGGTVDLPIAVSPGPGGLGILGIQMRLQLGSAVVQSASFLTGDGWIYGWGGPATNVNADFAAAAAAGVGPLDSASPNVATVRVVVRGDAALGTDLPLTLTTMAFNEGSPSVQVVNGVLRVRTGGVGVPDGAASGLALAAPSPNPARTPLRLGFTLPRAAARTRLDVLSVDGRLVRTLADGALPAGVHDRTWDLRDTRGGAVPAGLYFVRLEADGGRRLARLAVLR